MTDFVDISKLHSVIVNALVVKNSKILISQRSLTEQHEPGKWTILGDKVDKTDGNVFNIVETTCAREVEEETGIKIKPLVQLITNNTYIRSNGQHVIALVCLCQWDSGEALSLEDTNDVRWVTQGELDNFEFPPNVKGYIEKGFQALNKQLTTI